MHSKLLSATHVGISARLIEVEVDVSYGLVNFSIVGLPDTGIKESVKRIQTALKNSGLPFPAKRITVNLAPADTKKEGSFFDLPIALGILLAENYISVSKEFLESTLFVGELSLDGTIRFTKGSLAIAREAARIGKKRLILGKENEKEAALIHEIEVCGFTHLTSLISVLKKETPLIVAPKTEIPYESCEQNLDFSQVKSQYQAKRALQIAAAGRHNIVFVGPPGSGKTMLAQRLSTLMPPLQFQEILEISTIYSVSGKLGNEQLITKRPFRAPHHTISQAALIGGGSYPQPGEVTLAHHGILFLDEFAEFKRSALEVLRQPLEEKTVSIARVNQTLELPASFLLIAALNPCPCGFLGDKTKQCSCSKQQIQKYLSTLSGPLLDRIDLQVPIMAVSYDTLKQKDAKIISSQDLKIGVDKALSMQQKRFNSSLKFNNAMKSDEVEKHCVLTQEAEHLVKMIFESHKLSMRGYHKLLKVARTIADLDESSIINEKHLSESIMYRCLDQYIAEQMK